MCSASNQRSKFLAVGEEFLRLVGECMSEGLIVETVQHGGGSVIVWGCFGGSRVGDFVKIGSNFTKRTV